MGPDGLNRCSWAGGAPEFLDYHDNEWSRPVDADSALFEKLSLEGFQSGLSWRTILAKRANFRAAFARFDIETVAAFTERDVTRLLTDPGIVRHRGKIEAVVNNAECAIALLESAGSLAGYLWQFEPVAPPEPQSVNSIPESVDLSRQLKKRGWKFVGPTTVFAFMQAVGLVNDHAHYCAFRAKADAARDAFTRRTARATGVDRAG
jgi:DNA-3-methyladenine glycosylase I